MIIRDLGSKLTLVTWTRCDFNRLEYDLVLVTLFLEMRAQPRVILSKVDPFILFNRMTVCNWPYKDQKHF